MTDATRSRIHPGLALVVLLACSGLAEYLVPTRIVAGSDTLRIAVFSVILLSSVALWLSGFAVMHRAGTPIEPGDPVKALVTSGPFRFSRNPLYVALLSAFVSFAILANSLWFVAGAIVLALLLNAAVIPSEEQALEEAFGDEFRAYRNRVRRWI